MTYSKNRRPVKRKLKLLVMLLSAIASATSARIDSNLDSDQALNDTSKQSVEELRIVLAEKSIPESVNLLDDNSVYFARVWPKVSSFNDAITLINFYGSQLWQQAKLIMRQSNSYDDRPLYWQRLKLSKLIRTNPPGFEISPAERQILLNQLEQSSRGLHDLHFKTDSNIKILLTGFDPFLLDRNIDQSNPSGVAALALDNTILEYNGLSAEINTLMVPVRYGDFDTGFVETVLAPFYLNESVDMIVTVSMGRSDFDLERFPGKRRSVTAPGNLNLYSGGSADNPVLMTLGGKPLSGPEFVEFSLPVEQMTKAKGSYKINDNHQVTSLSKTFKPQSLEQLKNEIAVAGSGGGYLSNEISYRSIRLRNILESKIPTGHIHTPRIQSHDAKVIGEIVTHIENMLKQSLTSLKTKDHK